MSQLSLAERAEIARLLAARRRSGLRQALGGAMRRWRRGSMVPDEIVIVPQDLRTSDPSFAIEVAQGHFGLAGRSAYLATGSPFDLRPPSDDWARELHGFAWLRHMRAAATPQAARTASVLVQDWMRHSRGRSRLAWEPGVLGRRLISWILNAGMLLEDVDQPTYDRIASSIAQQRTRLAASWQESCEGLPRLVALTALTYCELCMPARAQREGDTAALLSEELQRQLLPDGGHLSRNPGVLVDLLLDLLPLRQCYVTLDLPAPAGLEAAMSRILPMLRFMRLGDGTLARFNGMGPPSSAALATVLAYDSPNYPRLATAAHSAYVRLEGGPLIVVADVGTPPSLELSAGAHAGCLSFELSVDAEAVFVNCGAPGPAEQERRPQARATASHNTLTLGDRSSSRLVRHPGLERMVGGIPIRDPRRVDVSRPVDESADILEASHDGYEAEFGLLHFRRLAVSRNRPVLEGCDRLGPASGTLRLRQDVPFAIRFHLHPRITCRTADAVSATVELPGGEHWRLSVEGAELSIEPSIHLADRTGPAPSRQIVLRGATFGETEVRWRFEPVVRDEQDETAV
jgi:uncharacterized heparinase superfamily protein